MAHETIINPPELQILLNKFDDYSISFPAFSKDTILTATPFNDCYKIKVNDNYFDSDRDGLNIFNDIYYSEIPNNQDFLECLLSSNCITYPNVGDFEYIRKSYKNIHKKVYFAVDTNILYHRFISFSKLKEEKIVLAPTIKDEIESSINYKYNREEINEIKKIVRYNKNLFDEFRNRRIKKSRKAAYLALNELKLLNILNIDSVKIEQENYEQNDLKIVRELKAFENDSGALVVLLTADRAMVDFCRIESLDYFNFDYPNTFNINTCSAQQFRSLIFNLAVVFGFIKLNSTIIFGEFSGKHELDNLKIRFLNKNLYNKFEKDLSICRKLEKLNFDF